MTVRRVAAQTNGTSNGSGLDHVLTRRQLEERADAAARKILGVPGRKQAFAKLDRGELEGTMAEVEFIMLRTLLRSRPSRPGRRAR